MDKVVQTITKVEESYFDYSPSHDVLSFCRTNPGLHRHLNDPTVLEHTCSHGLNIEHSSISMKSNTWLINSIVRIIECARKCLISETTSSYAYMYLHVHTYSTYLPLHWVMFCRAYPDGQKHRSVWLTIAQPCEHPWLVGHTSRAEETMGIDKQQKWT